MRHDFIISTFPEIAPDTCEVEWKSRRDGLNYQLELRGERMSPYAPIFNRLSPQQGLFEVLHELSADYTLESKLIAQYKPPDYWNFFPPYPGNIPPGSPLWTADDEPPPTLDFSPPGNV